MSRHREQSVQNDEKELEYIVPPRTPQDNGIKCGTEKELDTCLPNVERQMDRIAVNSTPERLPVILEESEIAMLDETMKNELNKEGINTPTREDNLLQKRSTEAVELPALVTTRSNRVSKPNAKLRDYVCNKAINKITSEPKQHTSVYWTPAHMKHKLLSLAAALDFQQRHKFSSFVPGCWRKIDNKMDIEATLN